MVSEAYQQIVQQWQQIPTTCSQQQLDLNLVQQIFIQGLDLSLEQVKNINLGDNAGLQPDRLIYQDLNKPPALVVELKRRVPELAQAEPNNFIQQCQNHSLYRSAVGYQNQTNSGNGIKQYLDNSNPNINANCLASYGWIFNGDFFQLWRRIDGVIFPMTLIQKVTAENLPQLLDQLAYCINEPQRGMITSVWNRKGGVGKTTNTINIGATLAKKDDELKKEDKKVLLIDFDPQNDLSESLNIDPNNNANQFEDWLRKIKAKYPLEEIKKIVTNQIVKKRFTTTPSPAESFQLEVLSIPRQELENFNQEDPKKSNFPASTKQEKWSSIQKLIKMLSYDFDYIFIDIFANVSDLTAGSLMSCDTLLIPSDYSKKTLGHAADIYNQNMITVRNKRQEQSPLHIGPWNLGIVFSNCPNSGTLLENYIQNELSENNFYGKQYETRLKIYAQTKLAEYKHCPVICWQNSRITKSYKNLVNEVYLQQNLIDE